MAKIFKISGYLVDPKGENTRRWLRHALIVAGNNVNLFGQHIHVEERDIPDWNDDLPINQRNCDLAHCEKYFKDDDGWPVDSDRPLPFAGQKYRHFKGKIIEVVAISQDTEMPGQFIVVYKDKDSTIWHRPLGMFLSEVDHAKYPDVTQKYRFELVEG